MRTKQVIFGAAARDALLRGINTLGNAVAVTLGPKGRNVIIEREYGQGMHITKDGVTVAKAIKLPDYLENMGVELIKSVSEKTNEIAGDGTTTSTVLAQAIVVEGIKSVVAGMNPMDLKRGIDFATRTALANLDDITLPVSDENLETVTTISANSDASIGKIAADALKAVGKYGSITFGESNVIDDQLELLTGYRFENGWASNHFITDVATQETVLENPFILLCADELDEVDELVPLLQEVVKTNRPLLVIAREVKGRTLATLVTNHVQGKIRACAVRAPGFGDRRGMILDDIGIFTHGTTFDSTRGMEAKTAKIFNLGQAKKVIISKDFTTIIDGEGKKEDIAARVEDLANQLDIVENEYDNEKLRDRISTLKGVVAKIKIGASTEVEMKEKRDRFDDAIAAGKAALEEGIVPGGGVSLLSLADSIKDLKGENDDQTAGIKIVYRAMKVPFYQILRNANLQPDVYLEKLKEKFIGVNAQDGSIGNMIDMGIIDPAKVTRVSLLNSTSIAGLILTTEVAISMHPTESISAEEELSKARGFI